MQIQRQINQQQSLILTKNILLATIGSIAYVRMLFPESNFETKGLDGIAIKTIKKNSSIEANTILDWIQKGCFDALEKKYLASLVFGIYLDSKNPNDFEEQYEFKFDYQNNIISSQLGEISSCTRSLVRKLLLLTQSLEPLPENAYITMKLYYHDHTPIDYEPPLFKVT